MKFKEGLIFGLCVGLLAPSSQAQEAGRGAPPLVIKTETRLVVVDMVVRDKKGAASSLSAADFRVFEDGKERPISGFSAAGESAGNARVDYLAFVFDTSDAAAGASLPQFQVAREKVAEFAGAYVSPNRYMAVIDFNGDASIAQNFTLRADRIQRAALTPTLSIGSSFHLPSSNWVDATDPGAGSSAPAANRPGSASYRGRVELPILDGIVAIANSMAGIRGRKSLVVIGTGLDTPPGKQEQYDAALLACNRANVALYVTSTVLADLAQATGGQQIKGDLRKTMAAVADEEAKRFSLTFAPVESPDGSCHTLKVESKRSGLDVRARKSYCNEKPTDLLAVKSSQKSLEEFAAGAQGKSARLAVPFFYTGPGTATVHLAMEMDLPTLKFAARNGKQSADVDVIAMVYGADGELVGKFSDTEPINLATADDVKAFRARPYHYDRQIDLPAGKYTVRVAFGSGGESLGKVEAPLTIEAWDGRSLTISGVAIATATRKAAGLALELDPSLLEGRRPLIANSLEVVPSGDNRCRRGGTCFGYLEVYDPSMAKAVASAPRIRIAVLDRQTRRELVAGDLDVASFFRPGNSTLPVIFRVPAGQLPAGSYAVELKSASGAVRSVDLEVE